MSAKKGNDPGVLGSLPTTRPTRLSRRHEAGDGASGAAGSGKPKAEAKARPAASKAGAGTAKPAVRTTSKAGNGAAKTAAQTTSESGPRTLAGDPRAPKERKSGPRPVRSGAPALGRAAEGRREPPKPATPPRGTELVTTAVQAAGELAQFGFSVGSQAVRRAVRRFPRP